MPLNPNFIILMLISAVPLLLWAMGLFGSVLASEHARRIARLNSVARLSYLCAGLAALLCAVCGKALTATPFSLALPGNMGAAALSIYINTVTVIMISLVSFVGFVVARYTRNYLIIYQQAPSI